MNTNLRFGGGNSLERAIAACLLAMALAGFGSCQGGQGKEARRERARAGDFESYVLALSWAPAFCAESGSARSDRECDARRHIGFVVHGLWPQRSDGTTLEYCGRVPPVSYAIVEEMLGIMPERELIQHEWRAHGSCSGMPALDYFGAIRTAYSRIKIPRVLERSGRQMRTDPAQIERLFQNAAANTTPGSIRVACRQEELTEVRFCLSRNLQPIPCSNEVRECRAPSLIVRAVP